MDFNGIPDLCDAPCHRHRGQPTPVRGVAMMLKLFFGNQG